MQLLNGKRRYVIKLIFCLNIINPLLKVDANQLTELTSEQKACLRVSKRQDNGRVITLFLSNHTY